MNTFTSVMLYVTIITAQGQADIKYSMPMPDMLTCEEEASAFLAHKFPDEIGAKGLVAACSGKLADESPT